MSSVLEHLSIRWRLAGTSALLTFVILASFAAVVGQLTAARIRSDFDNETKAAAADLTNRLDVRPGLSSTIIRPQLDAYAAPQHAFIRIWNVHRPDEVHPVAFATLIYPARPTPPLFGAPEGNGVRRVGGYRVEERRKTLAYSNNFTATFYVQYGRKVSDLESTVSRVRFFLLLGVIGGTLLALVAGLLIARRAMGPIAALTGTAREIATTRDLTRRVPVPATEDEVAELATTLDEMLQALESSRQETEAALERQRQFVADASHELRTPLTSVLANLELLVDVLDGDRGEAARSALRSSQRMRRLVGDLLLLARADARRESPHAPTDVSRVVVEAAAELGPVADGHELRVDADREAVVEGARDELHRLALNLMENAIRHTPAGTHVHAQVVTEDGQVVLTVEDDGPGVPSDLRERIFERFVRGEGDRGGSFGLGLSIVRAVAESHGGTVALDESRPGARFVVRLPWARGAREQDAEAAGAPPAAPARA
jgi:two-component system, OmpR family, sensor kinase